MRIIDHFLDNHPDHNEEVMDWHCVVEFGYPQGPCSSQECGRCWQRELHVIDVQPEQKEKLQDIQVTLEAMREQMRELAMERAKLIKVRQAIVHEIATQTGLRSYAVAFNLAEADVAYVADSGQGWRRRD